jgi:hypothetical protein
MKINRKRPVGEKNVITYQQTYVDEPKSSVARKCEYGLQECAKKNGKKEQRKKEHGKKATQAGEAIPVV